MWLRKESISVRFGTSVASFTLNHCFTFSGFARCSTYPGCISILVANNTSFFGLNQAFHFYWNPKITVSSVEGVGASSLKVHSAPLVLCNRATHSITRDRSDSHWRLFPRISMICRYEWHTVDFAFDGTTHSILEKSVCTTCVFIQLNLKWILLELLKESGNQVQARANKLGIRDVPLHEKPLVLLVGNVLHVSSKQGTDLYYCESTQYAVESFCVQQQLVWIEPQCPPLLKYSYKMNLYVCCISSNK